MDAAPPQEQIDEWKRCLADLPDDLFFSIMRTYLGDLKTPFHKPRLVDQIIHLFSKDETIQRAIALIDKHDALVLTVIELLDKPTAQQILRLLHDSYDYFSFHNHLMNLQERLLIYSCTENPHLHLNPYLKPHLHKAILSPAALFPPATPVTTTANPPVAITEEICWSLLGALNSYTEPLKADGTLKKRFSDELQTIFSTVSEKGDIGIYYLLINALLKLGILQKRKAALILDYKRGTEFGSKSRAERLYYLWAAVCMSTDTAVENFAPSSISLHQLSHTAASVNRLCAMLPAGYSFERSSVQRMIVAAEPPIGDQSSIDPVDPRSIVLTLNKIGVLASSSKMLYRNPSLDDLFYDREESHPLLLHPDFTITVKPPLPFETGLFISELLQIRSFAAYPQFELSRESYLHGRRQFSFETVQARLTGLSSTPLPQNIRFSLESWESHYSSVMMIEGITLFLASHWDQMVRSHPDFFTYVVKDLGNGIYVMTAAQRRSWQTLLEEIGITPLPAIEGHSRTKNENSSSTTELPLPALPESPVKAEETAELFKSGSSDMSIKKADERVLKELRSELDRLPPNKSNNKKELEAQIEKKLFLFPYQLHNIQISPEVNEARGMNYSGKVRIIQQALQNEWDLLELVERTSSGKPQRHLVRPKELQKSGSELLLIGEKLPDNAELRVWVQKIGYIKKWKGSLFVRPKDYTQN